MSLTISKINQFNARDMIELDAMSALQHLNRQSRKDVLNELTNKKDEEKMETATLKIEKTTGECALHENLILVFGRPKIGKTTLLSQFPKALFLTTEAGTKHVTVDQVRIKTWLHFCGLVSMVTKNAEEYRDYQTFVIDTVDNLVALCDDYIANKRGVPSVSEADDFGKTWAAFSREMKKQVNLLVGTGRGICFTSHAEEKTVKVDSITNPFGPALANPKGEVTMIVPTLDKRPRKFILGLVDMILYMDMDGQSKRVLRTKPSHHFEAGDRSGKLPETFPVPMEGAYEVFVSHYYGDNGRNNLIARLNKAEQYLAQHQIDNFDQPTRVINSHKKHLQSENFEGVGAAMLETYLQHLRIKAKNAKKNGDK